MSERVEKNRYRDVAAFERIPPSAVEHIIFNESLLGESPDSRVRRFANPDYLLSKAGFFAGSKFTYEEADPQNLKLQPYGSNRAFVMQMAGVGLSDEHGNVYGQVNVKGVGKTTKISESESSEPYGLFGERHAIQDMHVSDVLAQHGARVSRGVAVITLKHDYLKGLKTRSYDLKKQVERVEGNKDYACLYVRLIGSDRPENQSLERGPFSGSAKITRAAKLLFQEEDVRGLENYLERYMLPAGIVARLNLIFGLPSSTYEDKYSALMPVIGHFFNYNRGVFDYVSRKHFGGTLEANIHRTNQDFTGMWIDWENSLPESGQLLRALSEIYAKDSSSPEQFSVALNAQSAGELRAEDLCKRLKCSLSQA